MGRAGTRDATILDCSSVEDAITSLGRLFGMSRDDLWEAIGHCEIDRQHRSVAPEDQVVQHLGCADVRDLPRPTAIRWFHATRAPVGSTFEEGILPTVAAVPKLWESVGAVAAQWTSPAEWIAYQCSFERADRPFSQQFHRKRNIQGWEGPFAFLVKDAALHKYDDHKDFTSICETLEDICADYEQVSGHPLREAYEAATRPCLVIFTRPGEWHGAVRAALNYVHREVVGLDQDFESNANFNGEGVPVPQSWIDCVEWL
jgi:hypothetical protein